MAKIRINITIDSELHEKLKTEAEKKGVSLSSYMSFICAEKLETKQALGVIEEMMVMMKAQEGKAEENPE